MNELEYLRAENARLQTRLTDAQRSLERTVRGLNDIQEQVRMLSMEVPKAFSGERALGRTEAASEIAEKIRYNLVCCDILEQGLDALMQQPGHAACYWGERSARIAELIK